MSQNQNITPNTFSWDSSKLTEEISKNQSELEKMKTSVHENIEALKSLNTTINQLVKDIDRQSQAQSSLTKQYEEGRLAMEQYNNAIKDSNQLSEQYIENHTAAVQQQANLTAEVANTQRSIAELNTEQRALNESLAASQSQVSENESGLFNYQKALGETFTSIISGVKQMASGDTIGGFEALKGGVSGLSENFKGLFNLLKTNPWLLILDAVITYAQAMYDYNQNVRELNTEVEQLANTSGIATDELRKGATAIQETFGTDFKDAVVEQKTLMDDFGISAQAAFEAYNQGLALGGAQNEEFGNSIQKYGSTFAEMGFSAQDFINIVNSGIDLSVYSEKLPQAMANASASLQQQSRETRDVLASSFGAPFADDILGRIQSGKTSVVDGLVEITQKSKDMNLNQQQLAQLTSTIFKDAGEGAGGVLKVFDELSVAQKVNAEGLTDLQKHVINLGKLNKDLGDAKDEAFKSDSMMAFQADMETAWKYIQIIWYKTLGGITTYLEGSIKGWKLIIMNTIDLFKLIPTTFHSVMQALSQDLLQIGGLAKLAGEAISDALHGNFSGAESKFDQIKKGMSNLFANTKREIKDFSNNVGNINIKNLDTIFSQEAGAIQYQKLQDDQKTKAPTPPKAVAIPRTNKQRDITSQKDTTSNSIADETKKAMEIAKNEAQIKADAAKVELANYIATNAEKLKSDQTLNRDRLQAQKDYYDHIRTLQQQINNEEEATKVKSIERKIDEINQKKVLSQNDLNELKNLNAERENIRKEYQSKEILLNSDTEEKKKDATLKYDTQVHDQKKLARTLAFQQKILDMEKEGGQEFEIQKIQEEQRFQDQLDTWATQNQIKMDLDEDGYISDQEIQMERDDLQNQYNLAKDEEEKQRIKNQLDALDAMTKQSADTQEQIEKAKERAKLQAISDTLGQAASLFAEHTVAYKALSVAQASINTYLGVTKVLAEYPGPIGWAMAAVQVAVGLANVAKIVGIKTQAARGMMIDGPSHANGGVPIMTPDGMIEAEGGEVIINKRSSALFRDELSAINQAGGGVKFANGGILGSNLATVQNSFAKTIDFSEMANTIGQKVLEGSILGTSAGSQDGFISLSQNRKIASGANY